MCARAFQGNTRKKNEHFMFIKIGETLRRSRELKYQRHDVRIQCRDVLECGSSNVATLGSNVMTFPSVLKSDVVTLRPIYREVYKIGSANIAMLRSNVTT